ncbi:DUF5060 domain-containing protein [Chitinophagaceae bacterium LB-8]|uniref:DUF5060 domain-containing protein n=1 Tax=Paraflavisolibacter caeni TaxID=2982496 RepID=A0A9X2XNE6_9BACT|nr:DUF5060 domain-containing protein [Paraflavisolibacter caeni]MCU7548009.1 DUF5060 domain-containing protein [Paraflavisolibacter caeni]
MNKIKNIILWFCYMVLPGLAATAQQKVAQWGRYEVLLKAGTDKNPFTNVSLKATFTGEDTSISVNGFYDGEGNYKIRFMPTRLGSWRYTTSSNLSQLNNKKGSLECVKPGGNNHGMVKVSDVYSFRYADGKPYYPFGTTAYAWNHMDQGVQKATLNALQQSGFNKIRMCVFPKNYSLVKEEPEVYPFELKGTKKDEKGNEIKVWDFERFNPVFFQRLEHCIDELDSLGIEADLILFHPYDKGRWGFDAMINETNIRYIKYLTARLASFRNVWWSLANEWDYVKAKTPADWDLIAKTVVANDPYRHLCSIHGATATYFDYWKPEFTHVSIQDESPVQSPGSAALLRQIYHKPIISDEVGYEGNLPYRWGRYSPEEMTYLVLNGVMGGTYVTHGECYMFKDDSDTIFWAKGGHFRGTSWKRIAFLRKLVEECPNSLQLADISRDNKTATAGNGYYFINFGKEINQSWLFNLPVKNADYKKVMPGTRFKVEIIDVWDMTITEYPGIFETTKEMDYRVYDKDFKKVNLPLKPLIVLRIKEIKGL